MNNKPFDDVKTSQDWYESIPASNKLVIMDPDGWDRTNYQYSFHEELITKKEFMKRLSFSTIMCHTKFNISDWGDS